MPSSVFLLMALATTPGAASAREPASAPHLSIPRVSSAGLISTAGTSAVSAAVREAGHAALLQGAGAGSVSAVVRGTRPAVVMASASAPTQGTAPDATATTATGPQDSSRGSTAETPAQEGSQTQGKPPAPETVITDLNAYPRAGDPGAVMDLGRAAAEAGAAALRAAALAMSKEATPRAPLADPDTSYAQGVEALQAKDARTAITHLSACVEAAPSRVDCRWELGWAHSMEAQWAEAFTQWTEVQKLQPDHPDLEGALAQARGQAMLQAKLSQGPQVINRPPPPADAKVRIRAVGDVMLGTTVPEGHLPPDGAGSVIAGVRPLLEDADLTFINLEGPLCDTGETKKCRSSRNCYAFRSPTEYGQYLKEAGVDLASTANNHSGDFGEECRRATEATLDTLGIAWSGAPGTVATVERNGLRIGMVAFHTSPSCNHLNNLETATGLVRIAAAEHDIVIVSFHGGAEGSKALHVPKGREKFYGEDRGDLRAFSRAVVDAGAHLVIGHGPHVVRGMEFYKGRLIAYSLGNFATYGRFNLRGPQGLGMVLEVELNRDGDFTAGRILPTKQVDRGIAVPDPKGAVIKLVRELTADDFPETGARIAEDGTVKVRGKGPVSSLDRVR
ncbi:CapA family protein [Myxococcus sp. Y35]|uniref:CapA family protein n=1 Tax=Pseudomyxococcus flavus TaxID=3115648 RepID=UPI003CF00700